MTPALSAIHTTTKLNHTWHVFRAHMYSPRLIELTITSDDKVSECCLSSPTEDTPYISSDGKMELQEKASACAHTSPPMSSPRPDTLLCCSGELQSPVTGEALPLDVVS